MRLKGNIGRIAVPLIAVIGLSAGYVKMDDTQRTTNSTAVTAKHQADKLKQVVVRLKDEATTRCNNENAGYDSERNLLAYLKDRQVTVQAAPLTPAQQANFDAAVALVPANTDCSMPSNTEGGK